MCETEEQCRTAAIERLWREHAGEVRRLCKRWMRPSRDVDEAIGRVALVAVRKFPDCATALTNPRSWLIRIAYHTCMDLHREERRAALQPLDDGDPALQTALLAGGSNPEQSAVTRQRVEEVLTAINELPAALRDTVTYSALHGMSYREIAAAMRTTEPNVRKRMQKARELVARALRDQRMRQMTASITGTSLPMPPM